MRPRTPLDWIAFVLLLVGAFAWGAFVLLLVGAFAWGAFVTDVNVLDRALEPIADPLDNMAFVLIALAGLYWVLRVAGLGERNRTP